MIAGWNAVNTGVVLLQLACLALGWVLQCFFLLLLLLSLLDGSLLGSEAAKYIQALNWLDTRICKLRSSHVQL